MEVMDKETKMEVKEHYITKHEYVILKSNWKKGLDEDFEPDAWHMVMYNLLRDKPLDRGFKEKTKNIQGNNSWYAFIQATDYIISQANPMRQKPLKEFFGVTIPKNFRDKINAARDSAFAKDQARYLAAAEAYKASLEAKVAAASD